VNDHQRSVLKTLLSSPGPSGFEQTAARVWRDEAATFAEDVEHDVLGNSYASINRNRSPLVVIEGHIDEIGFIVTYIDDDGFIWFDKIGGWDDQVIVGQRVQIASASAQVSGVIGKKAAHLLKPADRERVTASDDLWIDIGASSKADAESRVEVGDPIVLDVQPLALTDDLWVSRSSDNRVGAFVALEALRLLTENPPECGVVAVAATQEEINMSGALNLASRLKPTVAIAIDVTHATDYPGAAKKADNDVKLGGGPVLTRGSSINPKVFQGLRDAGQRLGISTPVQAAARSSGTDADAFLRSGQNIASGLVSIPNRYMHSPNEIVSLADVEAAASLIAEFVRTISGASDFRP
jgi:endoglucanase